MSTRQIAGVTLATATLLAAACAKGPERACEGLTFTEHGVARAEYLPCVGAMLDEMAHLDSLTDKLVANDEASRLDAVATYGRLHRMMKDVGGEKRLREGWDDAGLAGLNDALVDAYQLYDIEFLGVAHPMKILRGTSEHNMQMAKKWGGYARARYEAMGGK
jgi:hypothetical protein